MGYERLKTPLADKWKVKGYVSNANDMPEESFVYYEDACVLERRMHAAEEQVREVKALLGTLMRVVGAPE